MSGDLDCIRAKCLEKDRARRYESARSLASDLRRPLLNEPVAAQPPSAIYQFQRAFRRNRLVFALAGAVALALLQGSGVSARQTFQAQRAEQLQAEAETHAEQARQTAILSRRSQYSADMIATDAAIQAGNYGRAREMLRQYFPRTGLEELRGFEWRYWWQLSAGAQIKSFSRTGEVRSMDWSPDGRRIAADGSDHTVKLLNAETGEAASTLKGHLSRIVSVAFSFDGHALATSAEDGRVCFWDVRAGSLLFTLPHRYAHVACSPKGPLMAIGTEGDAWGQTGGDVHLVDTDKGKTLRVLLRGGDRAAIWDLDLQRVVKVLTGHKSTMTSIRFSPDLKTIATTSWDGTARLWDAASGMELAVLAGHKSPVVNCAFAPDGRSLATGSDERTLRIWNLATRREVACLQSDRGAYLLVFSPDGQILLANNAADRLRCRRAPGLVEIDAAASVAGVTAP